MSTPQFIGLIYITGTIIYCIYERNKYIKSRTRMGNKYQYLLSLFKANNTYNKVNNITSNSMSIILSNSKNIATFIIIQTIGIISIEVEIKKIKSESHKNIEWFFNSSNNQKYIYDKIIKDMYNSGIKTCIFFDSQLEKKDVDNLPVHYSLTTPALDNGAELFCISWNALKLMDSFKPLSKKSKAEVLILNSLLSLQVFKRSETLTYEKTEEDILNLLLFYLSKNNLINQIGNLSIFMNSRISFYIKELEKIAESKPFNLQKIYYLFYIHPLTEDRTTMKVLSFNSDFEKRLLSMLTEVQNKTENHLHLES